MKALVLSEHGDLDKLGLVKDKPVPQPGDGEVLVRVGASSFNYHDIFTVRGMPGIRVPLPVVIGLDIAGTVVEDAGEWKAGDRVMVNPLRAGIGLMGEMVDGGMEEYVVVSADQLFRIPDNVSFHQAAALPVAYGTAHRMLITHNTVRPGDRVLILGASGGVGTASIIIAKMLGAEVIACGGSDEKCARLKELGADYTINYNTTDFVKYVYAQYGKPQRRTFDGGVDVLINYTGGDTWAKSLKAVKRGGTILVCGATAGYDPKEDLRYIWTFELNVKGSNSFYRDNLEDLLNLVSEKRIDPVIDRVLPLDEAIDGLALIRDRKVIGKIIVDPTL